jgi:hypothetical protein
MAQRLKLTTVFLLGFLALGAITSTNSDNGFISKAYAMGGS